MTSGSTWVSRAWAVMAKDLTSELRTRYALNAIGLFALTTLAAVSFSVGPFALDMEVASAFLWVVIFFSAMSGLSRTFVKEEEARTALALSLAADPGAVYAGKLAFNIALLFAIDAIVVPGFVAMLGIRVPSPLAFAAVVAIGSLGLVATSTIAGAIVAKADAKSALFAVITFPIAVPVLVTAVNGTTLVLSGADFGAVWPDLRVLVSFTGIIITVSSLVFEFVWQA